MGSRCEDGTATGEFLDELPNFYIDTFFELEEHPERFAEVSEGVASYADATEGDVEIFIEGEENANTEKRPSMTARR